MWTRADEEVEKGEEKKEHKIKRRRIKVDQNQ